jgi:hypothetical protein
MITKVNQWFEYLKKSITVKTFQDKVGLNVREKIFMLST